MAFFSFRNCLLSPNPNLEIMKAVTISIKSRFLNTLFICVALFLFLFIPVAKAAALDEEEPNPLEGRWDMVI